MPLIASRANASALSYGFTRSALPYRWVVVGESGALWTSDDTDGATWTSRTSSFTTTNINGVASDGRGLFVAVGDTGKLATSPDGITWTQQTSSFSSTNINDVVWGGQWVAVGDAGKIATSPDGFTWTQRTSGTAEDLLVCEWGDGLFFVGADDNGVALTASDPTSTWTGVTTNNNRHSVAHYWKSKDIWIVGHGTGGASCLKTSSDAVSWTSRDFADGGFLPGEPMDLASLPSIVIGTYVDQGLPNFQKLESSTNGTSWTNRSYPDASGSTYVSSSDNVANFVVVSSSNVFHSTNGTSWTDVTATKPTGTMNAMCHSSGRPAIAT